MVNNQAQREWNTWIFDSFSLHDRTSAKQTISVQHCPTEEIVADSFTKLLQGSIFAKLWNFIMGAEYADPD